MYLKMQIVFLGTSCMVPTKERSHSAILIRYKAEGILVDCGEGTQRQLKIAGIKPTCITKILITHWHGDHVLGLPGLIQTLGASDYNKVLEIYGPKGTREHLEMVLKAFMFEEKIKYNVKEVGNGRFFENKDFILEAGELEHIIPTVGYNFIEKDRRRINLSYVKKREIPEGPLLGKLQDGKDIEFKGKKVMVKDATYIVKGKKLSFILDTLVCDNCYRLAHNSDLLVCEAAYTSELEDKAEEYKHMTSRQAGLIANKANVKKLVLTHFSARYKNALELQKDAQDVFDNVVCAEDFMKIKL
jgi:ribonuclease Z